MSRSVHLCLAAAAALLLAGPARAEDPPNLVGTWKGIAHAVHIGSNPYRVAEKAGPNFPENGSSPPMRSPSSTATASPAACRAANMARL